MVFMPKHTYVHEDNSHRHENTASNECRHGWHELAGRFATPNYPQSIINQQDVPPCALESAKKNYSESVGWAGVMPLNQSGRRPGSMNALCADVNLACPSLPVCKVLPHAVAYYFMDSPMGMATCFLFTKIVAIQPMMDYAMDCRTSLSISLVEPRKQPGPGPTRDDTQPQLTNLSPPRHWERSQNQVPFGTYVQTLETK